MRRSFDEWNREIAAQSVVDPSKEIKSVDIRTAAAILNAVAQVVSRFADNPALSEVPSKDLAAAVLVGLEIAKQALTLEEIIQQVEEKKKKKA